MKMMTTMRPLAVVVGLLTVLAVPTRALAHSGSHDGGSRDIELHVGNAYESCYFDLHSALTARQFRQFAAEGGQMGHFRQVSGASTLGAGVFDVSLGYSYFFLDDAKGAWNNTMSHPQADHYLGQELGIPNLTLRVGLTDRLDAEVYGTLNWQSNYGIVGVATKIRVLEQGHGSPVSVAIRPSASALVGPAEVQVYTLAGDASVSYRIGGFEPFAGVGLRSTVAIDNSDDTDVGHQDAHRPIAFAGLDYHWRFVSAGASAEISDLAAVAVRLGGRF